MAIDAETEGADHEEVAKKKTRRKAQRDGAGASGAGDLQELEKRVRIAELRAREVEAEVRYLEATAKRREMKMGKRGKEKKKERGGRKKKDKSGGGSEG